MTDNQFQELFRLVTTAVTKISSVEEKVINLENRFDNLEGRFDGLEKQVEDFRAETNENFKQLRKEIKILNKMDAKQGKDIIDLDNDFEELSERVEILEKKAA